MTKKFCDIVFSDECMEFDKKLGYNEVYLESDFRIVKGGSLARNQKAVRSKIDILLDPTSSRGLEFDSAVAQVAHDNDITIAFSLASILDSKGLDRITLLRNIKFVIQLCKKKGAEVALVTGARDVYGVRDPLDLVSLGIMLGLTRPQAVWSVSEAIKK